MSHNPNPRYHTWVDMHGRGTGYRRPTAYRVKRDTQSWTAAWLLVAFVTLILIAAVIVSQGGV